MTEITFGYSDGEDRIWLSSSAGVRFWLTRRLLIGLLPRTCELLTQTVPGGEMPYALSQNMRVSLEHEAALNDNLDGRPALEHNKPSRTGTDSAAPSPPRLATQVTVQASGQQCQLIVESGEQRSQIELNRTDFHRLLAAIARVANAAGWALPGLPDWLKP